MSGFVDHLQNIARVHEVSKHLDIDEARVMLDQFVATWELLRDKFDLSESLKIHILKQVTRTSLLTLSTTTWKGLASLKMLLLLRWSITSTILNVPALTGVTPLLQ